MRATMKNSITRLKNGAAQPGMKRRKHRKRTVFSASGVGMNYFPVC